jgi:ribosomal protein L37AE/L43A
MTIDYGNGLTNIDHATGIRYGVISAHEVTQAWADSSEADYGDPTCPRCGGAVVEYDGDTHDDYAGSGVADYACETCERYWESGDCYGEEPRAWTLEDAEYTASQSGDDSDIFVLKSPYYTLAEYCSPCAPGAGYIMNEGDVKAYCFGHDWFDEGVAPYAVYSVETGELVPAQARGDAAY